MEFKIRSINDFNGFFMPEALVFNGHSCLLTGKNGCGKTRLLKSISNYTSETTINGNKVSGNDVSMINILSSNLGVFTMEGNGKLVETLAEQLLVLIHTKQDSLEEQNTSVNLNPRSSYNSSHIANIKDILNGATTLFAKKAEELSSEELQLSIHVNRDLYNNIHDEVGGNPFINLSQFNIGHHQTIRLNEILAFNNTKNDEIKPLNDDCLFKNMHPQSPHEIFNDIIKNLFRNKFYLSPPPEKLKHLVYKPTLTLQSNNSQIDINNLSEGEKTIFWLALKTFEIKYLTPGADLNNRKLILLDEPDSHLHPQMTVDFFECLELLNKSLNVSFLFTTHSPTTVALMDNDNIFNLEFEVTDNSYKARKVSKDEAISQLLDGVSQVSINPENSRQIYVENSNDQSIYEVVYNHIKNRSKTISSKIPLTFISSGPKIPENELKKHIISVYGNDEKVSRLITAINGDGDCEEVIGMVEHLVDRGNKTVRGIIDWDNKKRSLRKEIIIFAEGYAYSIENVVYDPLSIYAYLAYENALPLNYFFECAPDFPWIDAISDTETAQKIVDSVTLRVLGRENKRNYAINYMNAPSLKGDREYFIPTEGNTGHTLEDKILEVYPQIKRLANKTSGKPLMYFFMSKATINLLGWEYINSSFDELFSKIN